MDGWMDGWVDGWYSRPLIHPHDASVVAERMGVSSSPLEGELAGRGN